MAAGLPSVAAVGWLADAGSCGGQPAVAAAAIFCTPTPA